MSDRQKIDGASLIILKRVGFVILGVFCLLYSIQSKAFAEIHVEPAFLDFPIFVGEWLLLFCILLAVVIFWIGPKTNKSPLFLLLLYLGWLLVKTFVGYKEGGPLALRNAALFYYPFFAVASYSFYHESFFRNEGWLWILLLSSVDVLVHFNFSYLLPALILYLTFIDTLPQTLLKAMALFIFPLLFYRHPELLNNGRAHFIGMCAVLFYFLFISSWLLWKNRPKSFFFFALFAFLSVLFFLSFSTIRSSWAQLRLVNQKLQAKIAPNKNGFKFETLTTRLYFPDDSAPWSSNATPSNPAPSDLTLSEKIAKLFHGEKFEASFFFRFYIWKDMLSEWYQYAPWVGISFAHPLRSPTIEMLKWAWGEWHGVGWLIPHNSFFHMVYRGGLVGILIIFGMIYGFLKMTACFVRRHCVIGILLCGILVYWGITACSIGFLELPYTAIPLWSFVGFLLAYQRQSIGYFPFKLGSNSTKKPSL